MSAVQFKKGALVRNLTDDSEDITPGKTYKVTETAENVVHFNDDANYPRYRPGDRYEVVRASSRDYVADHARRTLRKAGLSKEEARQVVENWGSSVPLSSFSRKVPAVFSDVGPAQFLWAGFTWDQTPQGHEYWFKIAKRIEKEQNAQTQ